MALTAAHNYCSAYLAFASVLVLMLQLNIRLPLLVEAQHFNFSMELIHRDSSSTSPFYNASATPSTRLSNALQRSAKRARRFKELTSGQSVVSSGDGDYLVRVSIGTPPIEMLAILDTGSDLGWTQCEPCGECFHQATPIFNPKASSTYRNLTCDSKPCRSLDDVQCESDDTCYYTYGYGDGSSTEGLLATDTVTFGSISLQDTTIGCGTYNEGNFDGAGLVGFGQGPISLLSRMRDLIDAKFSYCLVPPSYSNHSSKINFGPNSQVLGRAVHSTPLVSGDVDTFYYITLKSISIESERGNIHVLVPAAPSPSVLPMILDSGTTLTYLPWDIYDAVVANLKKLIPSEPVDDPAKGLDLCYRSAGLKFPEIVMHFTDAKVRLSEENSFLRTSEDVACFAFLPADGMVVYGNTQQANFLIGYDLKEKQISFRKTHCTQY